jgi:hypothetical protein
MLCVPDKESMHENVSASSAIGYPDRGTASFPLNLAHLHAPTNGFLHATGKSHGSQLHRIQEQCTHP